MRCTRRARLSRPVLPAPFAHARAAPAAPVGELGFVRRYTRPVNPSDSLILARAVYTSWTDRLFSEAMAGFILTLVTIVSALAVPLLARNRPTDAPYFSGVFALALCPFFCCVLSAFLRIHILVEGYSNLADSYIENSLQLARTLFIFGGVLSLFLGTRDRQIIGFLWGHFGALGWDPGGWGPSVFKSRNEHIPASPATARVPAVRIRRSAAVT